LGAANEDFDRSHCLAIDQPRVDLADDSPKVGNPIGAEDVE
jgi:hypothetical protein